jgi:Major Facilitator Superfamily
VDRKRVEAGEIGLWNPNRHIRHDRLGEHGAAASLLRHRPSVRCADRRSLPETVKPSSPIALLSRTAGRFRLGPAYRGRLPPRGKILVLTSGIAAFLVAYAGLAFVGPSLIALALVFAVGGIGIAFVETAEHSAVAVLTPPEIRGSAFGLLAAVQSFGNLAASAIAGVLWTLVSPRAAFLYLAAWMLVALVGFSLYRRGGTVHRR